MHALQTVTVVYVGSFKNPSAQVEHPAVVAGLGQVAQPTLHFLLELKKLC